MILTEKKTMVRQFRYPNKHLVFDPLFTFSFCVCVLLNA